MGNRFFGMCRGTERLTENYTRLYQSPTGLDWILDPVSSGPIKKINFGFVYPKYSYILGESKKMSVSNKGAFLTNGHFFDSPCSRLNWERWESC